MCYCHFTSPHLIYKTMLSMPLTPQIAESSELRASVEDLRRRLRRAESQSELVDRTIVRKLLVTWFQARRGVCYHDLCHVMM